MEDHKEAHKGHAAKEHKAHHSHAKPHSSHVEESTSAPSVTTVLVVLGILQVLLLGMLVYQVADIRSGFSDLTEGVVPSGNDAPAAAPTPSAPVDVSADDDAVKGDADAPVTIIEFSDFECPFCSRFYTDTLPQIQKEYIDTGIVKLVYRDFPLSFHQNAKPAAEAAECAAEQGKFWEMHDALFENYNVLSRAKYTQLATDIGVEDISAFDECVDSGVMGAEVDKDFADGRAAGVTGTPSFFVNGQKISGAQPFSAFKAAVDAALAAQE